MSQNCVDYHLDCFHSAISDSTAMGNLLAFAADTFVVAAVLIAKAK